MYKEQNKYAVILVLLLLNFSCWTYSDISKEADKRTNNTFHEESINNFSSNEIKENDLEQHLENKFAPYSGWWIYGEGEHFFKDESSLKEWSLEFLNEDEQQLIELYLAICEMEFFPMESIMNGVLKNDTLLVESFEIIYVQGCGE
tara:strand:+ start:516 stop:953 length:438 start_codon:yes stop_codon:yes gene_type:complete